MRIVMYNTRTNRICTVLNNLQHDRYSGPAGTPRSRVEICIGPQFAI
jgi:hypothetical protein